MNDLETRLSEMLHERAAEARPDDRLGDLLHGARTGMRTAHRDRRRWLAAAAAVVVIAGGVWVLSRRTANDTVTTPDRTTTSTVAPDPNVAAWQPLAPPSLRARSGNVSISTGDGWFVWGGYASFDVDPNSHTLADGAFFDGATGEWRLLPPAPFAAAEVDGSHEAAVWTGSEVIVVGSIDTPRVMAFDPASFTWRTIAVPDDIVGAWPRSSGSYEPGRYRFVDGQIVLFFAPTPTDTSSGVVLLLDPVTGDWTVGATPPATMPALVWFRSLVAASDSELFVLDTEGRDSKGSCLGTAALLYMYDVQGDAWREEPLQRADWQPAIMGWTGDRLVLAGGHTCGGEWPASAVHDTALFDPVTGAWTSGVALPVDLAEVNTDTVRLGNEVVAMGVDVRPLIFDPDTDQWWLGPSPLPDGSKAEATAVAVAGRLWMWSPGLHRTTTGGSVCCFPTGEAYTLIVPSPERWGEVAVATIPTLQPTTTITGDTIWLPTSSVVATASS